MIIDPDLRERQKFGVQGKLGYIKTHPNLNNSLYRDLEKFIKGNQGLKSSGGVLANKLEKPHGFEQSHVFDSQSTRQRVQKRLETQLTEYLQSVVGEQAKAQNMSIPAFLQSQGIRGIREVGRGENKRLSAYSMDNFVENVQNPITGSTERRVKAFMRKIGAQNSDSGGTNEGRRLTSFLRPGEAQFVNKIIQSDAEAVSIGSYNKGDMEAYYASKQQRIEAKAAQNAFKNFFSIDMLNANSPAAVAEMKSKILKQQAEKDLRQRTEKEMIASGELKVEKDRKESPAKSAAKGAVGFAMSAISLMKKIASGVSSAIQYLNKMAVYLGSMLKNSASLGVNLKTATQLENWARFNPLYSGGNSNVLLDSAHAFLATTGDETRLANSDFDLAAKRGYQGLIDISVRNARSKKPDPVKTMSEAYGYMAQRYFSIDNSTQEGKDARAAMLAEHVMVLDSVFAGSGAGYASLIRWGDFGKRITNSTEAETIVQRALSSVSGSPEADPIGYLMTQMIGGVTDDEIGNSGNMASLNDILGVLQRLETGSMKVILANMGTIVGLLTSVAKGFLSIAAIKSESAQYTLDSLNEITKEQAKIGLDDTITNRVKTNNSLIDTLIGMGYAPWRARVLSGELNSLEDIKRLKLDTVGPNGKPMDTKSWRWKQMVVDVGLKETFLKREKAYKDQKEGDEKLLGGLGLPQTGNHKINNFLLSYGHRIISSRNLLKIDRSGRSDAAAPPVFLEDERKERIDAYNQRKQEIDDHQKKHGADEDLKKDEKDEKDEKKKKGLFEKILDSFTYQQAEPEINIGHLIGGDLAAKLAFASLGLSSAGDRGGTTVVRTETDPLEITNRVDIYVNGRQIVSNHSDESEKRYFHSQVNL